MTLEEANQIIVERHQDELKGIFDEAIRTAEQELAAAEGNLASAQSEAQNRVNRAIEDLHKAQADRSALDENPS